MKERESRWCHVTGGVSQECILFILFLLPQKFRSILLVNASYITIHFEHSFPYSKVNWGHWKGFLYKLFLSLIRFTTLWFCLPTGRTWKMPAGCRSMRTSSPRRSKSCMTFTPLAPKSGSMRTHKPHPRPPAQRHWCLTKGHPTIQPSTFRRIKWKCFSSMIWRVTYESPEHSSLLFST